MYPGETAAVQIPTIDLHVAPSEATAVPTWTDAAKAADILGQDTDGTLATSDLQSPANTGACPADTEFDGERYYDQQSGRIWICDSTAPAGYRWEVHVEHRAMRRPTPDSPQRCLWAP